MFLYSKEEQILMTSIRLPDIEPVYDKGQDIITFNWEVINKLKDAKCFYKLDLI